MKRIAILLLIALLAEIAGGCDYVIIERDSMRVMGSAALAEGGSLFRFSETDISYLDDEPENMTPSPSPTPSGDPGEPIPFEETPEPEYGQLITPVPTKMPKVRVTPEPSPSPTPYTEVVLGLHSRDEAGENKVRKAQERLVALGYLDAEPDGVFGSRTLKALMRFQKDAGLEETGVLDRATRKALYPQPAVTTAPQDVLYAEGSEGQDIRLIHQKLRQYGFSEREAGTVFDEETAEEVTRFQTYAVKWYGTEFDDPMTEPALLADTTFGDMTIQTADIKDPFGIPEMPVLAPETTLRPHHATDGAVSQNLYGYLKSDRFPVYRETVQTGDFGEEVERVQRRLKTLGYYENAISGEYDALTEGGIKAFQRRGGLQQTGIADAETQRLLFSQNAPMPASVDQPYYIKVSLDDQRVYVYRWLEDGYDLKVKEMICSTGMGSSTPRGVFVSPGHRDGRWHYFVDFNCWAQYAFVITGNILFHSILYSGKDESTIRMSSVHNLGHKASHGCVRLKVEDARWIYEHCGDGQVIEIY